MKLLLVGEDREGALLRSLERGLRPSCDVTVVDPARGVTQLVDSSSPAARLTRRFRASRTTACFSEAVEQLCPDVTLIVKGRGIASSAIAAARASTRVALYYPDNPFWRAGDSSDARKRLAAADLALVWSRRIRDLLVPTCHRVEMLPFGYDDRWFPLTAPGTPRDGVAFVGTWSLRRERYLRALDDLPLTIIGSGWQRARGLPSSPPAYGANAGAVLQRALIGVNVLHPHNAGAHNMRTREVAACGALQLTDPGTDGTPLSDHDGCRWFRSPVHLRRLVEHYLAAPGEARAIAKRAQDLVGGDTYRSRADQLVQLFRTLS